MSDVVLAVATMLALAGGVQAEDLDDNTPEGQATIKAGEVGRFDRDSMTEYGTSTRFESSIVWDSASKPRPEGHLARKVRYLADCKANTLVVTAVGVFDVSGRLLKSLITPPGAGEPTAPAAGTPQARWLQEACRNF
ncbi:MAG: hypothetical protein ABI612_20425 [Betaproteobacteria bacterium]